MGREATVRRHATRRCAWYILCAFIPASVGALAVQGSQPSRSASRQVPERSANDRADRIIQQYFDAIGGYSALKRVIARRMQGTYHEGSFHATTDIAWARPATRRVNVHAPGFEYSEGFDGSTWEYDFQTKALKQDTGAAADAGRRGAEFDESFVDYETKGSLVSFAGRDQINSREADVLQVTLSDGWTKQYFFDTGTHLILAMRKAMPVHATGPAVASLTYYGDWRRVAGLLMPHSFVEREIGSGRTMNTLHWDRIDVNPQLSAAELAPP